MGKISHHKNMGPWDMINNVFVTSMNKGQFPLALVGSIFALLVTRMSPEGADALALEIVRGIANGALLGYACLGLTLVGWFITSRAQRRIHAKEMERLSEERTKTQQLLLKDNISSSK